MLTNKKAAENGVMEPFQSKTHERTLFLSHHWTGLARPFHETSHKNVQP